MEVSLLESSAMKGPSLGDDTMPLLSDDDDGLSWHSAAAQSSDDVHGSDDGSYCSGGYRDADDLADGDDEGRLVSGVGGASQVAGRCRQSPPADTDVRDEDWPSDDLDVADWPAGEGEPAASQQPAVPHENRLASPPSIPGDDRLPYADEGKCTLNQSINQLINVLRTVIVCRVLESCALFTVEAFFI